jgi:hypothetical protein
MAGRTITQRIALDGGPRINGDLAEWVDLANGNAAKFNGAPESDMIASLRECEMVIAIVGDVARAIKMPTPDCAPIERLTAIFAESEAAVCRLAFLLRYPERAHEWPRLGLRLIASEGIVR